MTESTECDAAFWLGPREQSSDEGKQVRLIKVAPGPDPATGPARWEACIEVEPRKKAVVQLRQLEGLRWNHTLLWPSGFGNVPGLSASASTH
jgi:hypothetical protein